MRTEVPKLRIGQDYNVRMYPSREIIRAEYRGSGELEGSGKQHVFYDRERRRAVFVSNHWIEMDGGVITHIPISSFAIWAAGKTYLNEESKDVHKQESKKRTVSLLESLGVKL